MAEDVERVREARDVRGVPHALGVEGYAVDVLEHEGRKLREGRQDARTDPGLGCLDRVLDLHVRRYSEQHLVDARLQEPDDPPLAVDGHEMRDVAQAALHDGRRDLPSAPRGHPVDHVLKRRRPRAFGGTRIRCHGALVVSLRMPQSDLIARAGALVSLARGRSPMSSALDERVGKGSTSKEGKSCRCSR